MSFRPSPAVFRGGKSTSSKNWLSRQSGDVYTRKRLQSTDDWRSRSAFKLLELNEKYDNFLRKPHVRSIVDLGAAPGGWSQVVARLHGHHLDRSGSAERYGLPGDVDESSQLEATSEDAAGQSSSSAAKGEHRGKTRRGVKIVAVDKLRVQPISGVHSLQMDFLSPEADSTVGALFKTDTNPQGKVDVILSDMMANMTGNSVHDIEASLDICQAVWQFASRHLRTAKNIGHPRGGVLLIKHFQHQSLQEFRDQHLTPHFRSVLYIKPNASRSESSEGYWLCVGFRPSKGGEGEEP